MSKPKLAIVIGSIRPQVARQMLDQLAWWTAALKAAREKSLRQAA